MLQKIRVASDCKTVVTDINDGTKGIIAPIVEEIGGLAKDFQTCNFIFEGRLSNMA